MSVLIKGMTIPKSCFDCGISYVDEWGDHCPFGCYFDTTEDEYETQRAFDCPLVEFDDSKINSAP